MIEDDERRTILKDKNGKKLALVDYEANEIVGVQIGQTGHKLWVCIDGMAVLRVKAPAITLTDNRKRSRKMKQGKSTGEKQMMVHLVHSGNCVRAIYIKRTSALSAVNRLRNSHPHVPRGNYYVESIQLR